MSNIVSLPFTVKQNVLALAKNIKLVIFDVDGVLTDGSLFIGDDGQEYKAFNSRDGHGIKMLMKTGVETGIITGRTSKVVEHRVNDLGIKHIYQGCADKLPVYTNLLHELKLDAGQAAFFGDDVVDLPIMLRAGLAVTVQDGHHLVKKHAHWIAPSCGGHGAARELCEMIMYAQGNLSRELEDYL